MSYGRFKRSNDYTFAVHPVTGAALLTGSGDIKGSQYSMGYEHNLSKRTTVYANVRKVTNITNSCTAKSITGAVLTNNATATYVQSCGVAIETVIQYSTLKKAGLTTSASLTRSNRGDVQKNAGEQSPAFFIVSSTINIHQSSKITYQYSVNREKPNLFPIQ